MRLSLSSHPWQFFIPFAPSLSLLMKNHDNFLLQPTLDLTLTAWKTMNYLNLEIIDISLVVRIGMVDKSVCKCKNMCGKGNSGFEKEKCVLLSRKKRKESELEKKGMKKKKRKKYRIKKKRKENCNKTRSTTNQNWDEFGGNYMFLEREFVKEWLWWNVFIYLKIFELLYLILSINQTLKPLALLQASKALLILNLCATSWKWGEKKRVEKFEEWEFIHTLEFYKGPEKNLENFL